MKLTKDVFIKVSAIVAAIVVLIINIIEHGFLTGIGVFAIAAVVIAGILIAFEQIVEILPENKDENKN